MTYADIVNNNFIFFTLAIIVLTILIFSNKNKISKK